VAETPQANESESGAHAGLASAELRKLIEGMVRRKVPEMDVDDVVQTVLCDALANKEPPEETEQLRRWIAGITRHKVADFHRKGSRAKHVELPEQLEGEEPPLAARDLAEWADKQTEGDPDDKRTLDWMAREGGGEKLAHIAASERLPATHVRQRVSRLRRMMRQRWAAEIAAVAAIVIITLIAWEMMRDDPVTTPEPVPEIIPDPAPPRVVDPRLAEAERLRGKALDDCGNELWQECLDGLDAAKALDAEGDASDEIQKARAAANDKLEEQRLRDAEDKKKAKRQTTTEAPRPTTPVKPRPSAFKKSSPPSELDLKGQKQKQRFDKKANVKGQTKGKPKK
jgi:DNA-directed RNA polymerase specialized sigma24 family protein